MQLAKLSWITKTRSPRTWSPRSMGIHRTLAKAKSCQAGRPSRVWYCRAFRYSTVWLENFQSFMCLLYCSQSEAIDTIPTIQLNSYCSKLIGLRLISSDG